jgi:ankyrin repeat protein
MDNYDILSSDILNSINNNGNQNESTNKKHKVIIIKGSKKIKDKIKDNGGAKIEAKKESIDDMFKENHNDNIAANITTVSQEEENKNDNSKKDTATSEYEIHTKLSCKGDDLLMAALYNKDIMFAKNLMDAFPFDVHRKNELGYTALLFASTNSQHLPVIENLVSKGADISYIAPDGNTPYMAAASSNMSRIFGYYYNSHKNKIQINYKDKDSKTVFMYACLNANMGNEKNKFANVWFDLCKQMVKDGYDLSITDSNGLNGVMYILKNDLNEILNYAKHISDVAIRQIDNKGKNLMFYALDSFDYKICTKLLAIDSAIDINQQDDEEKTILILAAQISNPEYLDLILAYGPNLYIQDNTGTTALMYALENKYHKHATNILSYYDDNPDHYNAVDTIGNNALMYAICDKQIDIINKLLPYTDLSIVADDFNTALSYSIQVQDEYIQQLLMEKLGDNLYDFMTVYNNIKQSFDQTTYTDLC